MRRSLTSCAGAVVMTGALVLGGAGVSHAGASSSAQPAVHAQEAKKVRVTAQGGADVHARPHGNAKIVVHLGLGATVVLGGPTVTVHGYLWLKLRGGGWIRAHDVTTIT